MGLQGSWEGCREIYRIRENAEQQTSEAPRTTRSRGGKRQMSYFGPGCQDQGPPTCVTLLQILRAESLLGPVGAHSHPVATGSIGAPTTTGDLSRVKPPGPEMGPRTLIRPKPQTSSTEAGGGLGPCGQEHPEQPGQAEGLAEGALGKKRGIWRCRKSQVGRGRREHAGVTHHRCDRESQLLGLAPLWGHVSTNFRCQLDWALGCPGTWSHVILGAWGEMNISVGRLSTAGHPPSWGGPLQSTESPKGTESCPSSE